MKCCTKPLKSHTEKVRPQSLSLRQRRLCGQSLRRLIGPEKARNSAVSGGRLFTVSWRRKVRIRSLRPPFSVAVHLSHSVPTRLSCCKITFQARLCAPPSSQNLSPAQDAIAKLRTPLSRHHSVVLAGHGGTASSPNHAGMRSVTASPSGPLHIAKWKPLAGRAQLQHQTLVYRLSAYPMRVDHDPALGGSAERLRRRAW